MTQIAYDSKAGTIPAKIQDDTIDQRISLRLQNEKKIELAIKMVFQNSLTIPTNQHGDTHDLTEQVETVVKASGIKCGTVTVFNVGSTGAIGTIEFEPGLQEDLPMIFDRLMPPDRSYGHERAWQDGNGHSHLQATTLGPSITVPIADGHLVLGTWQQIFHLECDVKPRRRSIVVTVIGE